MARRKKQVAAAEAPTDDLAGTVEGLARDNFERERRAYEARTGKQVEYEVPVPVTRTPLTVGGEQEAVVGDQWPVVSEQEAVGSEPTAETAAAEMSAEAPETAAAEMSAEAPETADDGATAPEEEI